MLNVDCPKEGLLQRIRLFVCLQENSLTRSEAAC